MKQSIVHKSASRGIADHGWLHSRHTFSFAHYFDPQRMNFGALRVLNDDTVAAGMGFGEHPHRNMEIISIPLKGELRHQDSMGTTAIIREGEIQVMSAGSGITHSEYNHQSNQEVQFLQIWIVPNQQDVTPRYDQISIRELEKKNDFFQILSPNPSDQGVWIHQEAWFHMGILEKEHSTTYQFKNPDNGLYVFVLEGNIKVDGQELSDRDGLGIWETTEVLFESVTHARVLLMEIPMNF